VALEVTEAGRISFRTRHGEWRECELLPSSYVSPRLTILNLKPEGGRVRHVVLVPDNVDARDFRRLRTWLRWAAQPEA
jgi:toxin CptA